MEIKTQKEKRIELYNLIMSKNYGDMITIEEINNILQEDLISKNGYNKFRRQIRLVCNMLIYDGYVLKNIPNKGYYILKPNQVSSFTYRNYIIRPLNSLNKARTILDNTKTKKLNIDEELIHTKTSHLNNELFTSMNKILDSEKYKDLGEKNGKSNRN